MVYFSLWRLYSAKAQRIYHALLLYEQLLNKNGESMKNNITELFSIADNLDKVSHTHTHTNGRTCVHTHPHLRCNMHQYAFTYEKVTIWKEKGKKLRLHLHESTLIQTPSQVSKGTKIAGITGGATSAVGGIAAVAGVVLSPFTFGASLALTAIGVGVATAGGVTGASAAIAHKVSGRSLLCLLVFIHPNLL